MEKMFTPLGAILPPLRINGFYVYLHLHGPSLEGSIRNWEQWLLLGVQSGRLRRGGPLIILLSTKKKKWGENKGLWVAKRSNHVVKEGEAPQGSACWAPPLSWAGGASGALMRPLRSWEALGWRRAATSYNSGEGLFAQLQWFSWQPLLPFPTQEAFRILCSPHNSKLGKKKWFLVSFLTPCYNVPSPAFVSPGPQKSPHDSKATSPLILCFPTTEASAGCNSIFGGRKGVVAKRTA